MKQTRRIRFGWSLANHHDLNPCAGQNVVSGKCHGGAAWPYALPCSPQRGFISTSADGTAPRMTWSVRRGLGHRKSTRRFDLFRCKRPFFEPSSPAVVDLPRIYTLIVECAPGRDRDFSSGGDLAAQCHAFCHWPAGGAPPPLDVSATLTPSTASGDLWPRCRCAT